MWNFKKRLPSKESLLANRWLRWVTPYVGRHELWHFEKKAVAKGVAVGVFFAFAVPLAQIPMAVALAIVLRANIPAAAAATFVNTPLTFGPVYFVAYEIGLQLLTLAGNHALGLADKTMAVFIGALVLAVLGSVLAYGATHLLWKSEKSSS